ncbi:MAG: hypothetical protein PHE24_02655 [Patescibacteria group bacterium]|nr:hypothetical protein [Patescibacteria group bacterium]
MPIFYRFFLLILLTFSLLILPACATNNQPPARRVPQVLLGVDCGFNKLKCCATTPSCNYGQQCCVDPNDATRNYCSEDCGCGDNEEFCCAGNVCNGDAVCVKGICFACGEKDQVCCANGESCSSGLVCQNNKCAECGLNGEPCCASDSCLPKTGERSECLNNICANCGFDGNPSCATGDRCLIGQLLTGKTCERCGQSNQPCCNENSGAGYDCDPSQGLKCELGFCAADN